MAGSRPDAWGVELPWPPDPPNVSLSFLASTPIVAQMAALEQQFRQLGDEAYVTANGSMWLLNQRFRELVPAGPIPELSASAWLVLRALLAVAVLLMGVEVIS